MQLFIKKMSRPPESPSKKNRRTGGFFRDCRTHTEVSPPLFWFNMCTLISLLATRFQPIRLAVESSSTNRISTRQIFKYFEIKTCVNVCWSIIEYVPYVYNSAYCKLVTWCYIWLAPLQLAQAAKEGVVVDDVTSGHLHLWVFLTPSW
jgi:hypothetical protein